MFGWTSLDSGRAAAVCSARKEAGAKSLRKWEVPDLSSRLGLVLPRPVVLTIRYNKVFILKDPHGFFETQD